MKNKNSVLHELEKIEGVASQLNFFVKRGESIETYMEAIERLKDSVEQIRLYIESEQTVYN
jgi:hypothetical protein